MKHDEIVKREACSNCNTLYNPHDPNTINVMQGDDRLVAQLCPSCLQGTNVIKIVLRRRPDDNFGYDQFVALEMQAKAFGPRK
jgi:RNase P subunit RPR2